MLQATGDAPHPLLPENLLIRSQPIDFDGEVNLFHFVLLRCVGKGAFGKVRLVDAPMVISVQPSHPLQGPRGPAQANSRSLRPQVYQQNKMCQDEGRPQRDPGA